MTTWPKVLVSMPYEYLEALVRAKHLPPSRIASLPISGEARHSLLICCGGASDRTLRLHACWCARQALALIDSPDPSSVRAIEVAELFAIEQATEDELAQARDAAWRASITRDAPWYVAWAAAEDVAEAARVVAQEAAARYAARYAAWDIVRARQVDDLLARILAQ